jgi:hypothetical protein
MKAAFLVFFILLTIPVFAVMHKIGDCATNGDIAQILVSNNIAYARVWSSGWHPAAEIRAYDLSNPLVPMPLGDVINLNVADFCISDNIIYASGSEFGLRFVDISNHHNFQVIYQSEDFGTPGCVFVKDQLAYFTYADSVMKILNISNPAQPQLIGQCNIPSIAKGLTVAGNNVYLAQGDLGLQIVDVSDPQNPYLRGTYNTPGLALRVTVQDSIVYLADYLNGLEIISVINPDNPQILANIPITDISFTPFYTPYVNNESLYIAESSGLKYLNIANLVNPQLISTYDAYVNTFTVEGNTLYIGTIDDYIEIIDISDMSNPPELIGSYDTPFYARKLIVDNNIAYVIDRTSLQILNITNPQNPQFMSSYPCNQVDSEFWSISIQNHLAYISSDSRNLEILDVSDPSVPLYINYEYWEIGRVSCVQVIGHLAYLLFENSHIKILDIADPNNIQVLSTYGQNITTMTIANNIAYLTTLYSGIQFVDVSNPLIPVLLNTFSPGQSAGHAVAIDGNVAYVANYIAQIANLQIIDVSDLLNPILIRTIQLHPTSLITNVYVKDHLLYFSDEAWNEVYIYNITNNLDPVFVKKLATNNCTHGMYVENGFFYTANGFNGINIYDLGIVPDVDETTAHPPVLSISNYPNPFNPSTTISFALPKAGLVELDIYNIRGQKVKSLLNENFTSGNHTISWHGMNDCGSTVASGVYFARISSNGKTSSRKLVLLK